MFGGRLEGEDDRKKVKLEDGRLFGILEKMMVVIREDWGRNFEEVEFIRFGDYNYMLRVRGR